MSSLQTGQTYGISDAYVGMTDKSTNPYDFYKLIYVLSYKKLNRIYSDEFLFI